MTTTIPTPYDAAISAMSDLRSNHGHQELEQAFYALVNMREGYRLAKAEDAPLMEALKGFMRRTDALPASYLGVDISWLDACRTEGLTAIAQATGKETQ